MCNNTIQMWKYGIIYKHDIHNTVYNNNQVPWPSLKYLILIYYACR